MEVTKQVQLRFHGVDFPYINVNSKEPFFGKEEVFIDIRPRVYYPENKPNHFKIVQEIKLLAENYFEISVIAFGSFEINQNVDENIKKSFVGMNAPAIMFPYIRSFITTLTSNLGNVTGSVIIPTQFFNGDIEEISDLDFDDKF